jgi:hypothetical protein
MERFWNKVDKSEECWLWTAGKTKDGYGKINIDGKDLLAHRVSFFWSNGYYPSVVMHICDNPSCVNPDHLRGGTQSDNMADAYSKGRMKQRPIGVVRDTCRFGHPIDWILKSGERRCRTCHKTRNNKWYANNRKVSN